MHTLWSSPLTGFSTNGLSICPRGNEGTAVSARGGRQPRRGGGAGPARLGVADADVLLSLLKLLLAVRGRGVGLHVLVAADDDVAGDGDAVLEEAVVPAREEGQGESEE